MKVNVTVVIPTYNRASKLRETLAALARQTFVDFKVIVSDDGSSTDQLEEVRTVVKESSLRIDLLTGSNAGVSAATNRGIRSANDGLIILFDDDILPFPDCVEKHVLHHRHHPGSIVYGTAAMNPANAKTDVERYKLFMEQEWARTKGLTPDQPMKMDIGNITITAADLSFEKSTFSALGGFDETLKDSQDFDLGLRALRSGIGVWYDPSIRAYHNEDFSLRYYGERQKRYTMSWKIVIARYPGAEIGRGLDPRINFFKRSVYAILRRKTVSNWIERSAFFRIFPRKFRFRVYGSTIAAIASA